VALTQSQMIAAVADRAEMSKAETKRALAALDEIVLEELANAQKVRIGGLVQLTVRVKAAQKKRKGRQSGDRRGDRRRCQARERRCSSATAGQSQGIASVSAEGPATARRVERARLPVSPAGPMTYRSTKARRVHQGDHQAAARTDHRRHAGESCQGSSSTDHRGTGHCSCAHAKKSRPSGSLILRCSLARTIHGRSESCSVIVKPYSRKGEHMFAGWSSRATARSRRPFLLLASAVGRIV
jgi:DNA-binding protein HU-beta